MYMKKLRTPEWLKTSTFSCNTSVKLYTNGTRTLLKFCHLLTFCDVFSCILFTNNHKISLALRARRASAILLPLKKLLVLINTKYCTRNHVMTYTYSSVWVKSKEGWYQWQWPGFWQSHQQIQMTAHTWLIRVWLSLWLSMSTLVGIDVASDTIIIITLEQHGRRNDVYQRWHEEDLALLSRRLVFWNTVQKNKGKKHWISRKNNSITLN